MEFYFIHRLFSVLLLVALICTAQGGILPGKGPILRDIGNTFNRIGETITDTVKTVINSVQNKISETTETTETTEIETTTELESNATFDGRHIVGAPPRCPPNYAIINQRCHISG